jgi:hypothetical protein
VGKGKGEREGEAAPVTPPVRQDRRLFASAESCTNRREGRKGLSTLEGKPGRSKDQSAAVITYVAPPSTPSRP